MADAKIPYSRFDLKQGVGCDCLGRDHSSSRYFLSKNEPWEGQERTIFSPQRQQNSSSPSPNADKYKRSLRRVRPHALLPPHQKQGTDIHREYYHSPDTPTLIRERQVYEIRQVQMRSVSPKISFNLRPSREVPAVERKPVLMRVVSCQDLQLVNHSVVQKVHMPVPHPIFSSHTSPSPSTPSRGLPRPQPINLPFHPRSQLKLPDSPRREPKPQSRAQHQSIEDIQTSFQLSVSAVQNDNTGLKTERSIRSIRSIREEEYSPVEPANTKNQTLGIPGPEEGNNIYTSYLQVNNKTRFDQTETVRSKISPLKSIVGEVGKSRIGGGGKKVKISLKRIGDVEEIRSMADSDEERESDQESVVLGRLREYGSVQNSEADTFPSFQSKLGHQSTTAGKSLLKAFESNHFR